MDQINALVADLQTMQGTLVTLGIAIVAFTIGIPLVRRFVR